MVRSGEPAAWAGRTLHRGSGAGRVLRLDLPLSFWGGVGPDGTVVDRHHPQYGANLAGRVLVMTSGRGSSSSSSVLAELLRAGAGPQAIVLTEADPVVTLGALVADELYGVGTPVVQLVPEDHLAISDGVRVRVGGDALVSWVTTEPEAR